MTDLSDKPPKKEQNKTKQNPPKPQKNFFMEPKWGVWTSLSSPLHTRLISDVLMC